MNKSDIKKLALNGILSGALAFSVGACSKSEEKGAEAEDKGAVTEVDKADPGAAKAVKPDTPKTEAPKTEAGDKESRYSEIHMCAGLNTCEGLGGCEVTADKLAALAKAAGVPPEKAGEPHDCKGLNKCKGLGGCAVDEAKLAKLKEKLAAKKQAK